MNLNTKIVIYNNGKKYYEGTYEHFKIIPPHFYAIKWKCDFPPKGYDDNQLFDFIIEKVIRPENSIKCKVDFKCYAVDHYSYKLKEITSDAHFCYDHGVELFKNHLVVLVEEE